jgi:thioredoxin reductase (NADPH)
MTITAQLAIIGAGPAGLSSAIQAGRDGLQVLLISDESPGGLVRAAYRLDNLPGFAEGIAGQEFADRLVRQAERFGIEAKRGHVTSLSPHAGQFKLHVDWGEGNPGAVHASAVILATGTASNPYLWEIPEHKRDKLHRDARTLPEDIAGKNIAIIGGGEASLDVGLTAARRGAIVRVFARNKSFMAPERLIAEARAAGVAIEADSLVSLAHSDGPELRLGMSRGSTLVNFSVDHLVVSIGRVPNMRLLEPFPESVRNAQQVDSGFPGLFLAGDLIHGMNRFAGIAVGDGLLATRLAVGFLKTRQKKYSNVGGFDEPSR